MINVDDLKKAVLLSTKEEYAQQCAILGELATISLDNYRKVLAVIDAAAKELSNVEWVQARISQARDAVVSGWAYR